MGYPSIEEIFYQNSNKKNIHVVNSTIKVSGYLVNEKIESTSKRQYTLVRVIIYTKF